MIIATVSASISCTDVTVRVDGQDWNSTFCYNQTDNSTYYNNSIIYIQNYTNYTEYIYNNSVIYLDRLIYEDKIVYKDRVVYIDKPYYIQNYSTAPAAAEVPRQQIVVPRPVITASEPAASIEDEYSRSVINSKTIATFFGMVALLSGGAYWFMFRKKPGNLLPTV